MKNPPNDAVGFSKWLGEEGACREACVWAEGKMLSVIWATCERGDWLEWLLSHCDYQWKAPARAEYQRVMAAALAEYQRVKAAKIRELIPYPFSEEATSER